MAPAASALVAVLLTAFTAHAQPYPEGNTLEERQAWARKHPEYRPFKLAISAEDRVKYVACEENWTPQCESMRRGYQEKAAARIGGNQLPKAELSIQQKWAKQNPDWMPLGVPMSETDRNNWVICVEQPQWAGCAKIRDVYEKKKDERAAAKKTPPGAGQTTPGAPPPAAGTPAGAADAPAEGEAPAAAEAAPEPEPSSPPPGEEAAERARADGDKAISRARGLGDTLKKDLREEEGGKLGGAGQAGKDPGGPPSERDLMLASYSGYGASLAALGLSVGPDASGRPSLRRADGSPATAADLEALRARIAAEPEALRRRPDFFSKLPRARFQELKHDLQSRPDLRDGAFRDIALSGSGRDFVRAAACASLSGACAPDAKASYRKGDVVPPEELAAIHRRVHGGGDPDDDFVDEGPGDEWETEGAASAASIPVGDVESPAAPPAGAGAVRRAIERLTGGGAAAQAGVGGPGAASAARKAWGDVPGAAIEALERGRGVLSAAGAVLFVLAAVLLSRRAT